MNHRLVVLVLVGALTASHPASGVASDDVETCRGLSATIVGDGLGGDIEGTDGDDVIVTNGSVDVRAGGGDDVICTTSSPDGETAYVNFDGADGADTVDRSEDTGGPARIFGAEYVVGGDGDEHVFGSVVEAHTGAGDDQVATYSFERYGLTIDLGPGDDRFLVSFDNLPCPPRLGCRQARTSTLRGGEGTDTWEADIDQPGLWFLDLSRRRLTDPAERVTGLMGFESFDFGPLSHDEARLRIRGTERTDAITTLSVTLQRAVLRGGADTLALAAACDGSTVVRAGSGADEISVGLRSPACHQPVSVFGGDGDDRLSGGRGDDLLVGGSGRDRADGKAGSDRCPQIESRVSCER